jgi:hypothetical protein
MPHQEPTEQFTLKASTVKQLDYATAANSSRLLAMEQAKVSSLREKVNMQRLASHAFETGKPFN